MRKIFVGILVLFGFYVSLAQIKFDAKITGKHLQKVERAKDARSKLSSYKKFYTKDSLKSAKIAWKEYKETNKDSLKSIGKWKEAKAHKKEILLGEYTLKDPKEFVLDFTEFELPEDSLDFALQELARQGEFDQLQQFYESYAHYDSSYLDQFKVDSVQLDSLDLIERFGIKERIASYLPPELAQQTDINIADQMKMGELDHMGFIQKIDRSGVKDFFQKIPEKEFLKSQVSMETAKSKFSSVTNLEKKEEGMKRRSLEGTPLKERFFLNGNGTVQSTDPLILDLTTQIGYKMDKNFSLGLGISFKEQLNKRNGGDVSDAHGYSLFASYDIVKNFFVYGEHQRLKSSSLFSESIEMGTWQNINLLGVGKNFQITKKISLNILLLYDLNHDQHTFSPNRITPRIGYSIGF